VTVSRLTKGCPTKQFPLGAETQNQIIGTVTLLIRSSGP
jgi:hypothetical protein